MSKKETSSSSSCILFTFHFRFFAAKAIKICGNITRTATCARCLRRNGWRVHGVRHLFWHRKLCSTPRYLKKKKTSITLQKVEKLWNLGRKIVSKFIDECVNLFATLRVGFQRSSRIFQSSKTYSPCMHHQLSPPCIRCCLRTI